MSDTLPPFPADSSAGSIQPADSSAEPIRPVAQPELLEAQHNEAHCLAFTTCWDAEGHQWNITLREGVTSGELEKLLTAMQYTGKLAARHGISLDNPGLTAKAARAPTSKRKAGATAPAAKPAPAVKPVPNRKPPLRDMGFQAALEPGYERIYRIVINPNATDPDKPRVELWGKPNLKYPITTVPAQVLGAKLLARYENLEPAAFDYLLEPGATYTVDWAIQMVDSERLNRSGKPYRDVGTIVDFSLEEEEEERT